jgi:hypothetical protein
MQTHTQAAIQNLGPAALDLPIGLFAAIQKDATEMALTRSVLAEVRAVTPSSRTKALLDRRMPALDALHAEQASTTVPDFAPIS